MFHASTKQRLAALRRKYGVQLTPPKWARERSRRFKEVASAMKAAGDEAARQVVAALTPAPGAMLAVAGGPDGSDDSPTTVAEAPYPSQHLSSTDARALPGEPPPGAEESGPGRPKVWIWVVVLMAIGAALFARYSACSEPEVARRAEPAPAPQLPAAAEAPAPPPPAPAPAPSLRQITVARGDCLWQLSEKHLGDAQAWRRLHEANQTTIRNPDLIYPGQVFELPSR